MGMSNAFAAAGFSVASSSNSGNIEVQDHQQPQAQQDEETAQQQDALTLNDAIAATALLASVFKLGEQQQRLIIGGLLGTGLFAAPALQDSIEHCAEGSTAEQPKHATQTANCSTLSKQQQCGSADVKIEDAEQQQQASAGSAAAAAAPADPAAPAAVGSLQDSRQMHGQQQHGHISTAGSIASRTAAVAGKQVAQKQVQPDHSAAAAAGHQSMPPTALAYLAALLARQGAAATGAATTTGQ
jgi:hypothetical protein